VPRRLPRARGLDLVSSLDCDPDHISEIESPVTNRDVLASWCSHVELVSCE
jgi:hypothetical protein